MNRPYIHRSGPRRPVALAAFAAVVALGSCLAACGGDGGSSATGTSRPRSDYPSQTVPLITKATGERAQKSAQILAAWTAAEDAFETAALTANPYEPALRATTVFPALPHRQAFLETMRTVGDIARGSDDHGRPAVSAITTTSAVVTTCERADEIGVVASSGLPAAGEFGLEEIVLVTTTMEWTTSGWKLADETDEVENCHPA